MNELNRTEILDILIQISDNIYNVVNEHLGLRLYDPDIEVGDIVFELDKKAEKIITDYCKNNLNNFAYFSEEYGFIKQGDPEWIFIIDPIDGTRGAKSDLNTSMISLAAAKFKNNSQVTFSDIEVAVLAGIKEPLLITGIKDQGIKIYNKVKEKYITRKHSSVIKLENAALSFELIGRPARTLTHILSPIFNISGLRGGVFSFCSTTFSISSIMQGKLDLYIDIGGRILDEIPRSIKECERPMGMFPYDLAAAYLLALESGLVITDAWGNSLEQVSLLGKNSENIISCIAASTSELHRKSLNIINDEFKNLKNRRCFNHS